MREALQRSTPSTAPKPGARESLRADCRLSDRKSPRQIRDADPTHDTPDTRGQPVAADRRAEAIPDRVARLLRLLPDPVYSPIWKRGSAEDYARIFGGSGRTGTTASTNCAVAAYQSSRQRSPPAHRRGSGGCQDTRRSNRPCATATSTRSVSLDFMFLTQLNLVEPPGT